MRLYFFLPFRPSPDTTVNSILTKSNNTKIKEEKKINRDIGIPIDVE